MLRHAEQQSGRVSLSLLSDAGYDIHQAPLAWWLLASKKPKDLADISLPSRAVYLHQTIAATTDNTQAISLSGTEKVIAVVLRSERRAIATDRLFSTFRPPNQSPTTPASTKAAPPIASATIPLVHSLPLCKAPSTRGACSTNTHSRNIAPSKVITVRAIIPGHQARRSAGKRHPNKLRPEKNATESTR